MRMLRLTENEWNVIVELLEVDLEAREEYWEMVASDHVDDPETREEITKEINFVRELLQIVKCAPEA